MHVLWKFMKNEQGVAYIEKPIFLTLTIGIGVVFRKQISKLAKYIIATHFIENVFVNNIFTYSLLFVVIMLILGLLSFLLLTIILIATAHIESLSKK